MNVACLAIVTDTTVTRVSAVRKRFEAWRTPKDGELYALGQTEFQRSHELIEREQMQVVTNTASLTANGKAGPCAIIAVEGSDFLEIQLDRVDEAYTLHQLRHLQLTHYRLNELGDIQTVPPVFQSYKQLPSLGDALTTADFSKEEVGMILGGNYRRVFEASVG